MSLNFEINLSGNFIEALNRSNKGLGETEKHSSSAAHALHAFEAELGKIQAGALALNFNAFQEGGHFLQFDLAEGALIAFEAIKKVVEAVADLGKEMIKAAADAEDLNLAIKLDVGDEGAEKVASLAESFANTRFSPKQIKESLLPLLEDSGNQNQELWNDLTTAATDVATRRNTGAAGAKAALESLNDISLNPQRLRGSLKALGIHQLDFYKDLGGLLGITEKEAERQTKAGAVHSKTLLSVALNQIAQREGGALGNATNEGSKTLGATLARLGNLKDTLFESLAKSPGMVAIQGFLDNFIKVMQEEAPGVLRALSDTFADIFGDLAGPGGLQKIRDVFRSIAAKTKEWISDFREAWPAIKGFIADIPATIGKIVDLSKLFVGVWIGSSIVTGIASVTTALTTLGVVGAVSMGPIVAAFAAISAGVYLIEKNGGFGALYDRIKPHVSSAPLSKTQEAFPALQGAGAASRAASSAGFELQGFPAMADGGIVSRPTLALVGESGPEAIIPLGRGVGGGVTVTVGDIVVHASGGDAQDIARAVRIEVQRVMDEAAAAFGAAA